MFDPRTGRSWGVSDFDLNPELLADFAVMAPPRPAAVLVPIVVREQLTVLLTQRTEHLANHAGQIAFPGGMVDGVSSVDLLNVLLTPYPIESFEPGPSYLPRPAPTETDLFWETAKTLVRLPFDISKNLTDAIGQVRDPRSDSRRGL